MEQALVEKLESAARGGSNITVLTGAGISAESGIPTFRGPEGYWTIGAKEYHPQEMATRRMFAKTPQEVWKWYLYRMDVCLRAAPNAGHLAVAEMERLFGDRFALITQNVDGLHLRAGSSIERTYQIHGNVFFMRCAAECGQRIFPVPEALRGRDRGQEITASEKRLLTCPDCGGPSRPHVLWFDEIYDEPFYRLTSTLEKARATDLLIVVGTSGTTNLPNKVAWEVSRRLTATIVDINPERNPFAALALKYGGFALQSSSESVLPEILACFKNALSA